MSNGIVNEAFNRIMKGPETKADVVAYNKGVISGLDMLLSNIEIFIEDCQIYIQEEEEENGDETISS